MWIVITLLIIGLFMLNDMETNARIRYMEQREEEQRRREKEATPWQYPPHP